MGVLLDDIQLIQLANTNYNNYYLPEEPMTPFLGENPLGCWTLDIWDTRSNSTTAGRWLVAELDIAGDHVLNECHSDRGHKRAGRRHQRAARQH